MPNYKDICNKIKYLDKQEYNHIIQSLTGQQTTYFKHTSFRTTVDLKILSPSLSPSYTPTNQDYFRFFYHNGIYHIYHIQIADIANLLNQNRGIRFICLPIVYRNCHINTSHIGTVVFDLIGNEIILLEPNGNYPIKIVDRFMSIITDEINRYNYQFTFIPLSEWLISKRMLNYSYDNKEFGIGICATSNLYLIHKLLNLNDKCKLNSYLATLSDNDFVHDLKTFINKNLIF